MPNQTEICPKQIRGSLVLLKIRQTEHCPGQKIAILSKLEEQCVGYVCCAHSSKDSAQLVFCPLKPKQTENDPKQIHHSFVLFNA